MYRIKRAVCFSLLFIFTSLSLTLHANIGGGQGPAQYLQAHTMFYDGKSQQARIYKSTLSDIEAEHLSSIFPGQKLPGGDKHGTFIIISPKEPGVGPFSLLSCYSYFEALGSEPEVIWQSTPDSPDYGSLQHQNKLDLSCMRVEVNGARQPLMEFIEDNRISLTVVQQEPADSNRKRGEDTLVPEFFGGRQGEQLTHQGTGGSSGGGSDSDDDHQKHRRSGGFPVPTEQFLFYFKIAPAFSLVSLPKVRLQEALVPRVMIEVHHSHPLGDSVEQYSLDLETFSRFYAGEFEDDQITMFFEQLSGITMTINAIELAGEAVKMFLLNRAGLSLSLTRNNQSVPGILESPLGKKSSGPKSFGASGGGTSGSGASPTTPWWVSGGTGGSGSGGGGGGASGDSAIRCQYCLKSFNSERAKRNHEKHCPSAKTFVAGKRPTPAQLLPANNEELLAIQARAEYSQALRQLAGVIPGFPGFNWMEYYPVLSQTGLSVTQFTSIVRMGDPEKVLNELAAHFEAHYEDVKTAYDQLLSILITPSIVEETGSHPASVTMQRKMEEIRIGNPVRFRDVRTDRDFASAECPYSSLSGQMTGFGKYLFHTRQFQFPVNQSAVEAFVKTFYHILIDINPVVFDTDFNAMPWKNADDFMNFFYNYNYKANLTLASLYNTLSVNIHPGTLVIALIMALQDEEALSHHYQSLKGAFTSYLNIIRINDSSPDKESAQDYAANAGVWIFKELLTPEATGKQAAEPSETGSRHSSRHSSGHSSRQKTASSGLSLASELLQKESERMIMGGSTAVLPVVSALHARFLVEHSVKEQCLLMGLTSSVKMSIAVDALITKLKTKETAGDFNGALDDLVTIYDIFEYHCAMGKFTTLKMEAERLRQ